MIPNLRDVGETVNVLAGIEIMPEKVLYRGGTVNELFDKSELPPVNTILNLRTGRDRGFSNTKCIHIPAVDSVENYETRSARVKNWLNRVIVSIAKEEFYPLLIHCTAGKDRTGVVVALLLLVIGIDRDIIIEEYMESEGVKSTKNIETALDGIGDIETYLYDGALIPFMKKQLTNHSS